MTSKLHIISGMSRPKLTEAFIEYRTFIANHPSESVAQDLANVVRDMHEALHQQREIERAIR